VGNVIEQGPRVYIAAFLIRPGLDVPVQQLDVSHGCDFSSDESRWSLKLHDGVGVYPFFSSR
jgi:hypothetical protein